MKYVKWTALILVVVAIIAAVVLQWRRDTIAMEIANRVLKDTDFVVASLAVRKLGVDHIVLSSIVLEASGGTRYELTELDYPLAVKRAEPRRIEIQDVAINWGEGGADATSYKELVRTFLALPATLENTNVRVQHVFIQALPELSAITWTTSGSKQAFAAEVAGLAVNAVVTQAADDTHEVRITADDNATGASALRGLLSFTDRNQRIGVDGDLQVDLAVTEPLLRVLQWVPESAETMLATIDGRVAFDLDTDSDGNLALRFEPLFSAGSSLTWRGEDETRVAMTLDAETRFDVVLMYPSLQWTLDAQQLQGTVLLDDGSTISTTLSDVHCRAGMQCTLRAAARTGPFAWDDVTVESIEVAKASGITFDFTASGWSADVERIDMAVDKLRPAQGLLVSMNLVVSDLKLAEGLSSIEAEFGSSPGTGRLQYASFEFVVPGVQGKIERAGNALISSLRLFDTARSLSANLDIDYDVEAARGSARIRDGVIDFARRKLSNRIVGWPYQWDVIAGNWRVAADVDWTMASAGMAYRGHSTHDVAGLAGLYNDIGMAGLATTLEVSMDSASHFTIAPATVVIDLVDVGVPITKVTANVTPDVAGLAARVDALSGIALGGGFSIDPFTYATGAERNSLQVRLEHVQPQFMVDLAEFEQLEITGTMSGMLPVTLLGNAVRIDNGRLTNDPPGGVIRYRGGTATAGSNAQLAVVTGALSNFVYESLTASVDYTEQGDLKLGMRLEGINPDRDPTQPIILNLNVDNNIPQMLRSLQAVRSIEDILERRTAN